jgi:DNA-binding IclR family transcriptional regulator
VKSAERAMRVLQTLARHGRPTPTMAIARACEVPKSSAHNLLNAMRAQGFVTYHPAEHAWALGPAAFEVGSAYLRAGALQRHAQHGLDETAEQLGRPCQLWVPVGSEARCVAAARPAGQVAAVDIRVGARVPGHSAAAGLAIMSVLTGAQLRALYPAEAADPAVGPAGLFHALEHVRVTGHALDDGALGPGIGYVAAPVVARDGLPLGAVGAAFLVAAEGDRRVTALAETLRGLAGRLAAGGGPGLLVTRADGAVDGAVGGARTR